MDILSFFGKKHSSSNVAKARLQLVLAQDRLNISSHILEMMKTDIIKVISNYIEIEDTELDIQVSQDNQHGSMLIANIPVKDLRKTKE